MRPLRVLAAFIMVYALAWAVYLASLSPVDRSILRDLYSDRRMLNEDANASGASGSYYGESMRRAALLSLAPFSFDRDYVVRVTDGSYVAGGRRYMDKNERRLARDKLRLPELLADSGIDYPAVLAYRKTRGPIYKVGCIDPATSYIAKPISGSQGHGVQAVKGSDAEALLQQRRNFLVQERADNCSRQPARHVRVITLWDSVEPFMFVEYLGVDGEVASNHARGGVATRCEGFACPGSDAEEQVLFRELAAKLARVHHAKLPTVFGVGWDVMVDCKDRKRLVVLEANARPGVSSIVRDPPQIDAYRDAAQSYRDHRDSIG